MQILIIQACQAHSQAGAQRQQRDAQGQKKDAGHANTAEKRHVELERPHTLLLMSTVAGGMSHRGAFTGAIASQFALADGKKTIDEMVTYAKIAMDRKPDSKFQTSETRSTLKKCLVLPPAAPKSDLQQNQNMFSKQCLMEKLGLPKLK